MNKILFIILMSAYFIYYPFNLYSTEAETHVSYPVLFDEICQIVEKHFYNASLIQEKFPSLKKKYVKDVKAASTQAEFITAVNAMLRQLNTSHTYYLSPHDYEYYHLAGVFSFLPAVQELFQHQEIKYPTVGILTETIKNQIFIASVLPGSVAEKAGLLAGDEIIAVNKTPYYPIDSLKDYVGKQVEFDVKRSSNGSTQTFMMIPTLMNPKTEMLEAEKSSIHVIENKGKQIGYIHIYSYAGEEYHQELVSAISWGALKDADALIIDLRYGLGGADPSYLNIFNHNIPVLTSVDKNGKKYHYDPQWRKPAVFLANKATRSGKEILAFGAKKYKSAFVIGEQTAGAVAGGRLFLLSNGDLLYLACRSTEIDGVNLEGVGVTPDIEVPMDIRYCKGKDRQLDQAVEFLTEKLLLNKSS